jgi:glycosyltransferase involved in cell wall biosynthesis
LKDTPKIKLFVEAHCFDKEHQGTRAFIKRLYTELSTAFPEELELYLGAKNIENLQQEFKDIPGCKFIRYRSSTTLYRLLIEIPFLIRKHKINIAHFQYIAPFVKNCKFIVTTHDVLFKDFKSEFSFLYRLTRDLLFGHSLVNADIVTTVSEYSKRSIQNHFRLKAKSIYLTPNTVSDDFFKPYDKTLSRNYVKERFGLTKFILYVSRFEPRKNHFLLLSAYLDLKLHEKGYSLALLGHSSMPTPRFDDLLKSIPKEIRKLIFISESVNDQDLFHFYRGAELFVYPSKAEGFGLPPIEAGALKIPVICSNATAMNDFTFFGDYHTDPENQKLFTEKIDRIINHPPTDEELTKISGSISNKDPFRNGCRQLYQAILKATERA